MTRQLRQAPSPGKIVSIVPLEVLDRTRLRGGFAMPEGLHFGSLPARRDIGEGRQALQHAETSCLRLPRETGEAKTGLKEARLTFMRRAPPRRLLPPRDLPIPSRACAARETSSFPHRGQKIAFGATVEPDAPTIGIGSIENANT